MDKIKKALEACEKVVDGIEDGTITTESALLQCSKIARLTMMKKILFGFNMNMVVIRETLKEKLSVMHGILHIKRGEVIKKMESYIFLQN